MRFRLAVSRRRASFLKLSFGHAKERENNGGENNSMLDMLLIILPSIILPVVALASPPLDR